MALSRGGNRHRHQQDTDSQAAGIDRPGSPPTLRVAAFGDSVMWGQGLDRTETFAAQVTAGLGELLGVPAELAVNRARSGAVLIERGDRRVQFLDTFSALFASDQERQAFLAGDDQPATRLHGEIPASFPTVQWQVDSLDPREGAAIDIVLLCGGANDLGVDSVINPQQFPGAFIQEFDGKICGICHDDMLAQIRRTRIKCPHAVIIVFGYYAPISHASDGDKIREFFRAEHHNDVTWFINSWLHIEDIEQMIAEARIRSEWWQARAQHWLRTAVTTANRAREIRGPGVLFVPAGFTPDQAGFAEQSLLFEDYLHPTGDAAQAVRQQACPRVEALAQLQEMGPKIGDGDASADEIRALHTALDGPASMLDLLDALAEDPSNEETRTEARDRILAEVHRIQHTLIVSFLHPSPDGARRYAANALARFREHRELVARVFAAGRPAATLDATLRRYGMRSKDVLLADLGHLDVDALSLFIVTRRDSDPHLAPDISLVIDTHDPTGAVGQRTFRLNFPYRIERTLGGKIEVKKLYPHFEPGDTARFTIDTANDLRLDHITRISLAMGTANDDPDAAWRPRRVRLDINGVPVLDRTFDDAVLRAGTVLNLGYPSAGPGRSISGPPLPAHASPRPTPA